MGLFKAMKGMEYLSDMKKNKEKKKKFDTATAKSVGEDNSVENIFDSPNIHVLLMDESAGSFGKRTFSITNPAGDVLYTAKKSGTFKYPHFKLVSHSGKEVGSVKTAWSNYKPIFTLKINGRECQLKQTTITKSMYDLCGYGWHIKSEIGKSIICNNEWQQIVRIEWHNTRLKGSTRTDVYKVKILDPKDEIASLVVALAIYISHRSEYL